MGREYTYMSEFTIINRLLNVLHARVLMSTYDFNENLVRTRRIQNPIKDLR